MAALAALAAGAVGLLTMGPAATAQTTAQATPPNYSATYRVTPGAGSGSSTVTTTTSSSGTTSASTTGTATGSTSGTATVRLDCTDATACKIAEFVTGGPPWIAAADLLPFPITGAGSSGAVSIPNCEGARVTMDANLEAVGTATVSGVRYPASLTGTIETAISAGTDDNGAPCGDEKWTYTFAKSATTTTTVAAGPAFTPNPKKKVSLRLSGGANATLNGNKANCLGDLVGISGRNYPALGADGYLEFRRNEFSRGNINGEMVVGDAPTFTKKNTIVTFDTTLKSAGASGTFEVLLEGRIKCARFGA